MKRLRINIISETPFITRAQEGVRTAFLNSVALLKKRDDLEVFVNSKQRCDVIYSHTYGPYYLYKALLYRGRRVITAHVIPESAKGSLMFYEFFKPLISWYFKRVYNFSDLVIAVSPMVKESLLRLGVRTRIEILPNPLPLERFYPSEKLREIGRRRLGLSKSDKVILGVGQIQPRKGIRTFINVARELPQYKFVWVGGQLLSYLTDSSLELRRSIKRAPENLSFVGILPLEEMPSIYNAADIFFFPSYQENCSMVIMEAAACGLPILLRDLKEYASLYDHPYIKAQTEQEFKKLIVKLAEDEEFYREAVEKSRVFIKQFDPDNINQRLVGLFRSLNYHECF